MTSEMRAMLKQAVSMASLERALREVRLHGSFDCEYCLRPIEPRTPRKRFCCSACQRKWHYLDYEPRRKKA